jgi:ribonuclease HI
MPSKVTIYTDGGARGNPGPAAIGVLILDEEGEELAEHGEVIGATTNNVAEYTAVLVALEIAAQFKPSEIVHYTDSQLVAEQLSGRYKIKMPHLLELWKQVKEKEKKFQRVTYTQVPRTHEKIRHVDGLVNMALDAAGH